MRKSKGLHPDVPPLAPLPPKAQSLTPASRWIVVAILALYLGLSAGHAAYTPVLSPEKGSLINAPDEPAHRGYIEVMAREGRLPRQGDATYEWHQPPLYYTAVAPFSSSPIAARWVSVMLGLASLGVIFAAVRRMFPSDPVLAVFAMGFAALIPMRQAVYAAVGNDVLLELFCSLVFLVLIPAFTHGFTLRRAAVIGFVLGGALLTKANAILLVPLLLYALYLLRRQADETPRSVIGGGVFLFAVAISASAPMVVRNIQLYGEPTPIRAFQQEFAGTSKATDWIGGPLDADLWTGTISESEPLSRFGYLRLVANWTFRSFFAAYTPLNRAAAGVPFFAQPPIFYVPFIVLVLAAAAGLTRLHFRRSEEFTRTQLAYIWLMFTFLGLVVLAFAGFVWTYFQAQGRYLYPAMLPVATLSAIGIRAAVPASRRDAVAVGVLALMAILAIAFLFVYVEPTYAAGSHNP